MKCLFNLLILILMLLGAESTSHDKRNITVEVSIVTDFGLYKKWKSFYNGDARESVKGIYYMYANVYKTVRDRFWGVEMEGVRFNLRFANTHVSTKKEMAGFIENKRVKVKQDTIDEERAVDALEKFVSDPVNGFKSSDVTLLVTGYQLKGKIGSYMRGSLITKDKAYMVVSEVGLHRTADMVTRNLAEAMGGFSDVIYDVTNAKGFIMTANRSQITYEKNSNIENIDKFSPETIKGFKLVFEKKVYSWDQVNPSENKTDVDWCARTHPIGLTYPAHRQCKFLYGPTSTNCTDNSALDVCIRLGCTEPSTGQCTFSGDQRAYDRTACGTCQWCLKGKCVRDLNAPPRKTYDYYVKYE